MVSADSQTRHRTMLITGATGFIGSRLAGVALNRQYVVRSLSRSDWTGPPPVPREQRYRGSLPEAIPGEVMQGVDVVVHFAACVDEAEKIAMAVNVEGSTSLAAMGTKVTLQCFIDLLLQFSQPAT